MLLDSSAVAPRPLGSTKEVVSSPARICQNVVACVALDFGLNIPAIMAVTRGNPKVAFARQAAMYLAHTVFALSFGAVGRAFGRDRTTVAHACRVVEDSRDDIWIDCRLAALELACRAATETDNVMGFQQFGGIR